MARETHDLSSEQAAPALTLSVVSHGQGRLVRQLLTDLRHGVGCSFEVLVTINIPEAEDFLSGLEDLPLLVIRNGTAKGFGANHNAAFAQSRGVDFVVVNPDIRMQAVDLRPLLATLHRGKVGACGPIVVNAEGRVEDSARRFPSWTRLAQRLVARVTRRGPGRDYGWRDLPVPVDWLAGMFVMYRREAFAQVKGFDEGYYMYLEDADICRRLLRCGWSTLLDPRATVVHNAQRASHRSLQHLRWHLASAWRFLRRR